MSLLTSVTANTLKTISSGSSNVLRGGNSAGTMLNSYSTVRSTLAGLTGGKVNLPKASQTSLGGFLTRLNGVGQSAKTILNILGLSATAGNSAHLQASSNDYERGSFRWLEMETTPDSFATADSVLLFASESPVCDMGNELVPIGLCQGFQFSVGHSVVPFKELRCEENIIYPTKSQPGNMSISRICGNYSNLVTRLHIKPNWSFSAHSNDFRQLFGLLAIFASPSRDRTICSLYFERCAITNASMSVSAGNFQVVDNVSIMFGRCVTVGVDNVAPGLFDIMDNIKANAGKTGVAATAADGKPVKVDLKSDSTVDGEIWNNKKLREATAANGPVTVPQNTKVSSKAT